MVSKEEGKFRNTLELAVYDYWLFFNKKYDCGEDVDATHIAQFCLDCLDEYGATVDMENIH